MMLCSFGLGNKHKQIPAWMCWSAPLEEIRAHLGSTISAKGNSVSRIF